MSGPAVVSRGAAVVRVARTGPDGEVRVLEAAAAPGAPPAEVLSGLVEGAGAVVVPAEPALALAGRGDAVVLDVGHGPATVVRVRGGAVVARRSGPGGADLDAAVAALLARSAGPVPLAEARRVREALSLLPAVEVGPPGERVRVPAAAVHAVLRAPLGRLVDAVRELAAGDPVPVLVVGGVARTPLLARLLDEAGLPDVRVPSRPDAAALLAAHAALDPAAGPAPGPAARAVPGPWLPPPAPHRRGRVAAAVLAAVVILAGLHAAGTALAPAAAAPAVAPGVLVQYDYRLRLPDGWVHTGGLPERRRTLLTPRDAPRGSDLVVVESTPLGYDARAEPARAAAELRAEYDAAVAGGAALSGYDAAAELGGRRGTAYREDDGTGLVRWFVVLDGPSQLSVGCRHTPAGERRVLAACAEVVASLGR